MDARASAADIGNTVPTFRLISIRKSATRYGTRVRLVLENTVLSKVAWLVRRGLPPSDVGGMVTAMPSNSFGNVIPSE